MKPVMVSAYPTNTSTGRSSVGSLSSTLTHSFGGARVGASFTSLSTSLSISTAPLCFSFDTNGEIDQHVAIKCSFSTNLAPSIIRIFQLLQSLHHHLHGLVRHGSATPCAERCFYIRGSPAFCTAALYISSSQRRKIVFPLTPPHLLHLLSTDGAEGGKRHIYCVAIFFAPCKARNCMPYAFISFNRFFPRRHG